MDIDRFARLVRFLETSSRRGFLASSGIALSVSGLLLGLPGTEAKKKCKKKKKKPTPPLQLTFACPGPPENFLAFQLSDRVAQLFVAGRSVPLRRIQIPVEKIAGENDYILQLLSVSNSVPLHTGINVLAAVTISNAAVPAGESILTANFSGPELEEGVEYAAAVGRAGSLIVGMREDSGNDCAGVPFSAVGSGAFIASDELDLVVSVFVD
jgi:hypothetical protein